MLISKPTPNEDSGAIDGYVVFRARLRVVKEPVDRTPFVSAPFLAKYQFICCQARYSQSTIHLLSGILMFLFTGKLTVAANGCWGFV